MLAKQVSATLPKWLVQGIILALLAVIAGGVGSWVGGVNHGISAAATVDAVQEEKIERTNNDIGEIKQSLRRIEDKIDNLK